MIVYLPGAMRDLRGISQWYGAKRPEGEARFFERLRMTMGRIEREPQSFPHALEALDVRKARVLRSPYSVAYIARTDHVRILAVIHGARRPGFWTRRAEEEPNE